jgi:hypothetical protein
MPVVFIDSPPGIRLDAKQIMVRKTSNAIDEAYHIGDMRERLVEHVAMDGQLQSENPMIRSALQKVRRTDSRAVLEAQWSKLDKSSS